MPLSAFSDAFGTMLFYFCLLEPVVSKIEFRKISNLILGCLKCQNHSNISGVRSRTPPPSRNPPLLRDPQISKQRFRGLQNPQNKGFRGLQPPKQRFRGLQPPQNRGFGVRNLQNRGFGVCNLPKTGVSGFATSPKQGFRGLQPPQNRGFGGCNLQNRGIGSTKTGFRGPGRLRRLPKQGFGGGGVGCQNRISGPQKSIDCGAFTSQNCIFSAGFAGQKILRFWSSFLVQKNDF